MNEYIFAPVDEESAGVFLTKNIQTMKLTFFSPLLFLVLSMIQNLQAQSSPGMDSLTKFCEQFPIGTQLSAALVQDGKTTYYGVKKTEEGVIPIENQSAIFEIGSTSKVFTSSLLLYGVAEGKVDLETALKKYLKLNKKEKRQATLLQLSNHSSGLPRLPSNVFTLKTDMLNPYKTYGETELLEYLKMMKLSRAPGEGYEYSNLGVGLLGYILTQRFDRSYEELLQFYIFGKLEMKNSTTIRTKVENKLVKGLNIDGKEVPNWDFGILAGAGAILSSTEDMAKFLTANLNTHTIFDKQHEKTYTVNENMDMAYGWHIIKPKSGGQLHWHNGGTGGYTSFMAIDLEHKNGLVILSNISAFNANGQGLDKVGIEWLNGL